MLSPATAGFDRPEVSASLTSVMAGVPVISVVVGVSLPAALPDRSLTAGPAGGVPRTVAEFTTDPASISACVSV